MKTFYLGGARSGKSSLATQRAREEAEDVCCIVTATESDSEMSARIAAHRNQRPATWSVVEEPIKLGAALRAAGPRHSVVLIDCLTLWTANCLWPAPIATANPAIAPASSAAAAVAPVSTPSERDLWNAERESFLAALRDCASRVIIVSNEVGTGIIPANAASRVFVDEQGWLNQAVAKTCDEVYHAIAGIAVRIKPA
jgi:adenosylcobinamide kinase / adenosylcobinamide-phosphate guanylyltransferase